ncbi:MAG: 50S ribosomal protein L21 [Acidimicrobiaceae bacterium]|nr:50S ribosomal protein L21 [Acidimicrobiaceae bacterium]
MYAVIKTGGKQERVEQGQTLAVERLTAAAGDEVSFEPILVVDGDTVLARRDELAGARVSARVIGEATGPKVRGFTYKPKTRARRRWGHRQHYTEIEITGIAREIERASESQQPSASEAEPAAVPAPPAEAQEV